MCLRAPLTIVNLRFPYETGQSAPSHMNFGSRELFCSFRVPVEGTQRAVACPQEIQLSGGPFETVSETPVVGENNIQWYAVRVRSRHEGSVARHLSARGLEAFLPLYRRRSRWSDRVKEIEFPLFPGYVFCHFNVEDRLPILTVPGVVHVVGLGKTPTPIDEREIAAIRTAVNAGLYREPWPFLQIGNKVRIARGPLSGVEGVLVAAKGRERLVLSITLLQRSVAVQIDEEWVQPISPESPTASRRPLWHSVV